MTTSHPPASGTVAPYVDPPRHPIFELSDQLDEATDALMTAIDEEAAAEAAYKRRYAIAFLEHSKAAATIRSKLAEATAADEDVDLTYRKAHVRRWRAKCDQLHAQLSAWQSYMRREERVT